MRLLLLLSLVSVAACTQTLPVETVVPVCTPYPLRDVSEMGADFTWRQRLEIRFSQGGATRSMAFPVVLQKRGRVLRVVGLTAFGTRSFVLEQQGRDVVLLEPGPRPLPFPPHYILADIHRAFFPPPNEERSAEFCPGGRTTLQRAAGAHPSPRVVIHHVDRGLRLTVTTSVLR